MVRAGLPRGRRPREPACGRRAGGVRGDRRAARAGGRPRAGRARRVARSRGRLPARQAGREHPTGRDPRDRRGHRQLRRCAAPSPRAAWIRRSAGSGRGTARAADQPGREHRRDAEDDNVNFTRLATLILEQHGTSFTSSTRGGPGSTISRPAGSSPPSGGCQNLLLRPGPPETATYQNPVSANGSARGCGRWTPCWVGGAWPPPSRPHGLAQEDTRVRGTANSVYAAMFMAAAHAATLADVTAAEAADECTCRGATAEPARRGFRWQPAARAATGESISRQPPTAATARCTGCMRSTTPPWSPPRCTSCTEPGRRGDRQTSSPATRRTAGTIGSPAQRGRRPYRGRAGVSQLHDRVASSLPSFDASSIAGLTQRGLRDRMTG